MLSYRKKPPDLIGGALCVDFVNTVTWRGDPVDRGERLTSFDELLAWAAASGAVSKEAQSLIAAAAKADRRRSEAALADAIQLREALGRLLGGNSARSSSDLTTLNRVLREARQQMTLARDLTGFRWDGADSISPLRWILVSVARSAADVLTSDRLERIRSCADDRCSWMFIDDSRTGDRRWCDMKTCGNRFKVRMHYQRQRNRQASGKSSTSARVRRVKRSAASS
jgi:predicted RNA-binding Zn ribbon-like protein